MFAFNDQAPLIPLWLMLLWALLATTLRHCLAWTARPWWLASLLGGVAGPLSYYAGGNWPACSSPTVFGRFLLESAYSGR